MTQRMLFIMTLVVLNACSQEQPIEEPAQKVIDNHADESRVDELKNYQKETTRNEYVRSLSINPGDIVIGSPESKVVLIEYFSPTCPHCVHYHREIFPEIKEKYIDTNKISYVIREFISNKQDLDAAILARCNGNTDIYIKFLNVILNQQNNWAFSKNYREILTNIGSLGGVSPENFVKCLNDQDKIKILMENTKLAVSLPKFAGTPSFFINGKQFNERYTFAELSKALDKVVEELNVNPQ